MQGPVDVRARALRRRPSMRLRRTPGGVEQFGGHAEPLGALAGEDEDGPARPCGGAGDHVGVRARPRRARRGRARSSSRSRRAPRRGGRSAARLVASACGHAGRSGSGVGARSTQPAGLGAQGRSAVRAGQQPRQRHAGGAGRLVGRRPASAGGRLLEDDVGVGAADAEGGDGGAAGPPVARPGAGPRSAARPRRRSSRRAGSARRRAGSAAARRGASPCTILMTPATPAAAWVWPMLDLTEPSQQRLVGGAVLAVGGEQRLGLDRVAERGAGAVRLDRVDLGRRSRALARACADHPLLRRAVRRGQAVARAVLVDRASRGPRRAPGGRCARASDSRSTSSTPTPSPQPVPSAAAANGLAAAVRRPARAAG